MDVASTAAPPVVAVTVVHEPGPWFDEVLTGLRDQDYPNLRHLVLITGDPAGVAARVHGVLPSAHVREVAGNPGYGPAANEATRLVEGSGLFCFLHDDVALDPDAITRLVEELYRSNAGVVGPKLVEWSDPRVLQHVGFAVDRFGERDPLVEPGELDQEQHDAVRDVFALPPACLLVRADLFRTIGGFDDSIDYHGDALDLCWRAHLGGARVLVVPAARGRHRHALPERRPDLSHRRLAARHRIRTVATLTGRWRTPVVLLELVVVSLVEIVVGVFGGLSREGLASLYALFRLVPSLPRVISRRRAIRPLREVPDREVAALQFRGSTRLAGLIRQRRRRTEAAVGAVVADVDRTATYASLLLLVIFVFGSRSLITNGVPRLGQFVALPHPGTAWRQYLSAWRWTGFGSSTSAPPVLALVGSIGAVMFGKTGLLSTALVLLPIVLGYAGIWHALSFVPSTRARLGAVLVYAAVPLPYAAIASGRWAVIVTYGALPWAFSLLRTAGGLTTTAASDWGDDDIADAVSPVGSGRLTRIVVGLGLLGALVATISPFFPVLVVGVALLLSVGTLFARGSRSILTSVLVSIVGLAVAFVLLEPWSFSLLRSGSWSELVGPRLTGAHGAGFAAVAGFRIGRTSLGVLAPALYLPVLAGPLIARGWRLTWAARAAALVGGFLALAVASDRGSLPFRLPEVGLLLAPVALGLAIAAGCALAGFEHDIRNARFGWRQPLGLLVSLGLALGLFQGLVATAGGRWSSPHLAFANYLSQLPAATAPATTGSAAPNGDYRVLFVGDPRMLPLPARAISDGVSFGVANDGLLGLDDLFAAPTGPGERLTREALQAMATGTTDRVGRLLAPLSIRYVVVPLDDGIHDGRPSRIPAPSGLVDALARQLDFRLVDSPGQLVIYENTAWLPRTSFLDDTAAATSKEAGSELLAAVPVGHGTPAFAGVALERGASAVAPAGTLHLSVPTDPAWKVRLDGREVATRPAFGWSIAADLPAAGTVSVGLRRGSRWLLLVLQAVLGALAVAVAAGSRIRVRPGGRSSRAARRAMVDQPLIDLGDRPLPTELPPLFAIDDPSSPGGVDPWAIADAPVAPAFIDAEDFIDSGAFTGPADVLDTDPFADPADLSDPDELLAPDWYDDPEGDVP